MEGPITIIRDRRVPGVNHTDILYQWKERSAYLSLDEVTYRGAKGYLITYSNPPVHQVGNPGLDAYLEALALLGEHRDTHSFLLLLSVPDPVHAGGDLKESLTQLDATLAARKELEVRGAPPEEIDRLYAWGDRRLEKGCALYKRIRACASILRVVAVCGGGLRYGGSAEIPLMADVVVGDSRSGMCFSESMIGLIPGWSGVARAITKAGITNAKYLAMTAAECKAGALHAAGLYNAVVDIPLSFPKKEKTEDPERDEARYREALQVHADETLLLLLPTALELAVCPERAIPRVNESERLLLATEEAIVGEVRRRSDPQTYAGLWGRPLKEVREEITALGRPLAPQSVEALERLFGNVEASPIPEEAFVEAEREADARLYRDRRFRQGIIATLGQTVADFREGEDS